MPSSQRPRARSPIRPMLTFVAVLLLLYVIFNWSKPPVQTTDVSSGAAQRTMDAIKKQQAGQQAPKQ